MMTLDNLRAQEHGRGKIKGLYENVCENEKQTINKQNKTTTKTKQKRDLITYFQVVIYPLNY